MAYNDDVLALSPIAYWRLGESSGTTATDEIGSYDATYTNSPTLGATGLLEGDSDTAVTFDGTNDYIEKSTSDFRISDSQGSISFIFNTTKTSGSGTVFSSYMTSNSNYSIQVFVNSSGDIRFWQVNNDVGTVEGTSVGGFNDGNNHHVVITSDGSEYRFYVDGTDITGAVGNGDWFADTSNRNNIAIGTAVINGTPAQYFDGTIDEVFITSDVLTASEVTSLYASANNFDTSTYNGLVRSLSPSAYWRLGESSGTTATDEIGSYDGIYTGSPTLGVTGLLEGDADTAVSFDGTSQYVDRVEADFLSGDSQGSIVALINASDTTNNNFIFTSSDTATTVKRLQFYTVSSTGLLRFYTNTGSSENYITGTTNVCDGNTHHVAIVSDGTSWKFYVDGQEDTISATFGSNSGDWFTDIPDRDNILIGGRERTSVDGYFNGTIDEVAIFPDALTASEVSSLYASANNFDTSTYNGLVRSLLPLNYFRLEDDTTITNSASYDFTGTDGTDLTATGDWVVILNSRTATISSNKMLVDDPSDANTTFVGNNNCLIGNVEVTATIDVLESDGTGNQQLGSFNLLDRVTGNRIKVFYRDDINQWVSEIFDAGVGFGTSTQTSSGTDAKIKGVLNGTTAQVYIDDVLVRNETITTSMSANSNTLFFISNNVLDHHQFTVDDVSISCDSIKGVHYLACEVDPEVICYSNGYGVSSGQPSLISSDNTGKSFLFEGEGYYKLPDDDKHSINTTGELAVLFNLLLTNNQALQGIVSKGNSTFFEWDAYVFLGELIVRIVSSSQEVIREEKVTVAADTNYHVVINFTGTTSTDEIEIYLNGVKSNSLVSSDATKSYSNTTAEVNIGSYWSGVGDYFITSGRMDEVAFFPDTLTASEVSSLYTVATAAPASSVEAAITALNPSGYWKLDDGSAEAVTDSSGNGYDGYWVGVGSDEATQDDMLGDGVLGVKPSDSASTPTGYMENTAVFALGSADTGNYTLVTWAKGFGDTDFDIFAWATAQIASTKQYRGKLYATQTGELTWSRLYQSGPDIVNDTTFQSATTSGLGLQADVPYLFTLRENATTTDILVNGNVVLSLPRVGTGTDDTTVAPREELRIGNETVFSGDSTASSYVHGALWNSNLTNEQIQSIYEGYSSLDQDATMVTTQIGQTGSGTATITGTLSQEGTIAGYQEDRIIVGGEFISQSVSIAATYTSPDNYIVTNQTPQGMLASGNVTGDPLTVRYSTHGFTTSSDSTPANTPIAPKLLNAGNYKNEIDIKDVGVVTPSFGQVVLDNSDGSLDGLVDKSFDGGSYKLYYGPKGGKFPDDFTKVIDTVMGKPTFDHKSIKVQLKDKMDFLDLPVIPRNFTGTGGINGANTVKGEPKQRIIGRVWGAPVQLIDATKQVYWVCDDEMVNSYDTNDNNNYTDDFYRSPPNNWDDTYAALGYARVFDGGTQITNGNNYASEADVFAIEPAAGTVRWYRPSGFKGPVLFRLGSIPAADVRVDIDTTPNGSDNWKISDLIAERPEIDVSPSSVDVELERGFFVNDNTFSYKDAIKEFMKRDFYYARFDRNGEFKVSQVVVPLTSDTPLYEFNESNMAGITIEQRIPAWKININTGEAVGGQVNTGIPEARKDEFTDSGYHTTSTYEEPATRSRHKLSEIINVETKSWWNQDDIDVHSDLVKSYLMEDRIKITVSLDRGHINATTLLLDIGDVVSIKMPRYNYDLGKNFIVHGVRHDYGSGKLTYTLWG